MSNTDDEVTHNAPGQKKPYLRGLLALIVVLVAAVFTYGGYVYFISPASIRNPKIEHAHFRMQLVVNQKEVNFGDSKFQQSYAKNVCSDGLPESPIHFHDNKKQFVHLHWKNMTGGLVLKNYGWDLAGGPDGLLGYRLNEVPKVINVPIYGNVLPEKPKDAKLWVYTGSEGKYQVRSEADFLKQDSETFFGTKSLINAGNEYSFFNSLFPKAMAHSDKREESDVDKDLQRINNLLGSVVIFAQTNKPTDDQIKKQFNNLEPLSESTCGG